LSNNQLTSFKELENLPNLRTLNLNNNKIEQLDDNEPMLPALETLDLGKNKLASADNMKRLNHYSNLQTIIMAECPFVEEMADRFKSELLIVCGKDLTHIKMVNEEEVTEEDAAGANEERNARE
jgi:Leucine-rich repeat (LRR) protein